MRSRFRSGGFTLIELVITIVLTGIVVGFVATFITAPVKGYTDQVRRAELVDRADGTLRRMRRDIHRALPNSIRVTSSGARVALELLGTVDGVRYRAAPPPADPDRQLDFSVADNAFNAVGGFTRIALPFSSTSHYLSIYNVGVPGADAYELANVITPAGTQIDIDADSVAGEDNVSISPSFRFAFSSPRQRVFLVDGPVTWLCDTAAGSLRRYAGYTIAASQSARDSDGELTGAGAASTLVARDVAACSFDYTAGVAERAGLVSLQIGLARDGEAITLLEQVHVNNAP